MPETYQEKLTRLSALPESYKNSPKGHAGARGSRSCFPVSAETQSMVMFGDPKPADPALVASTVRDAILIIGANNGITEAQQSYTLVRTTAGNPSALTIVQGPDFVVDEVQPPPPAAPQLTPSELSEVQAFLARFGGRVVFGDK